MPINPPEQQKSKAPIILLKRIEQFPFAGPSVAEGKTIYLCALCDSAVKTLIDPIAHLKNKS